MISLTNGSQKNINSCIISGNQWLIYKAFKTDFQLFIVIPIDPFWRRIWWMSSPRNWEFNEHSEYAIIKASAVLSSHPTQGQTQAPQWGLCCPGGLRSAQYGIQLTSRTSDSLAYSKTRSSSESPSPPVSITECFWFIFGVEIGFLSKLDSILVFWEDLLIGRRYWSFTEDSSVTISEYLERLRSSPEHSYL